MIICFNKFICLQRKSFDFNGWEYETIKNEINASNFDYFDEMTKQPGWRWNGNMKKNETNEILNILYAHEWNWNDWLIMDK